MIYYPNQGDQMSGVVKINNTETEEEIKALLGKAKDAYSHEKLLAPRVAQNTNHRNCIVNSRPARKTLHHGAEMVVYLSSRGNGRIIISETPFGKTKNNHSRNSR
jgi:hypothetical protein